jgi:hypothetical protein
MAALQKAMIPQAMQLQSCSTKFEISLTHNLVLLSPQVMQVAEQATQSGAGVVHSCGAIAGAAAASTHSTCVPQGFEIFMSTAVMPGLFPIGAQRLCGLLGVVNEGGCWDAIPRLAEVRGLPACLRGGVAVPTR